MLDPRWHKVIGDVGLNQGRFVVMIIAIATGIFAVAAIGVAHAILSREINRSYLATNPAAAVLEVDALDDASIRAVRRLPGVAWAEPLQRVWGRIEVRTKEWLPILVFVRPSLTEQRINRLELVQGRWPVDASEVVLESTVQALIPAAVGRSVSVQTPNGIARSLKIIGLVHDAALPPAWQQQTAYAYATPATAQLLGETATPHSLALAVDGSPGASQEMERRVVAVAHWLQQAGHSVGEIRIPPRNHPHWGVMNNIVRMLLSFGLATLALAAVLTAAVTGTLLAPQVRQIGVMKAIGARSSDILILYAVLIAACGAVAAAVGMPLGILAGQALARTVAYNQNSDLLSQAVPAESLGLQIVAGLGLPLVAALLPIWQATRRPVRECLADHGLAPALRGRSLLRAKAGFGGIPWLTLALRNCLRRKRRMLLSLGLLGVAGALFITGLNVLEGWKHTLIDAGLERHYDVEILFAGPEPVAAALAIASQVAGVTHVEAVTHDRAAVGRGDGLNITRTFPDGSHGSLRVDTVPADSAFISPRLVQGRWLAGPDSKGAVLNTAALALFPGASVGEPIQITVKGGRVSLRIVGVVLEHLASATIYVPAATTTGAAGGLRIALGNHGDGAALDVAARLEQSLDAAGLRVFDASTRAQLGRAQAGHLFILIFILFAMSVLMVMVGMLGLASMLLTGILERLREFGILRAIGAGRGSVWLTVVGEGVVVAGASVGVAAVLSVPLTMAVVAVVGSASLGPTFNSALSAAALPLWLAVVVIGAIVASAFPARNVLALTVREALASSG